MVDVGGALGVLPPLLPVFPGREVRRLQQPRRIRTHGRCVSCTGAPGNTQTPGAGGAELRSTVYCSPPGPRGRRYSSEPSGARTSVPEGGAGPGPGSGRGAAARSARASWRRRRRSGGQLRLRSTRRTTSGLTPKPSARRSSGHSSGSSCRRNLRARRGHRLPLHPASPRPAPAAHRICSIASQVSVRSGAPRPAPSSRRSRAAFRRLRALRGEGHVSAPVLPAAGSAPPSRTSRPHPAPRSAAPAPRPTLPPPAAGTRPAAHRSAARPAPAPPWPEGGGAGAAPGRGKRGRRDGVPAWGAAPRHLGLRAPQPPMPSGSES